MASKLIEGIHYQDCLTVRYFSEFAGCSHPVIGKLRKNNLLPSTESGKIPKYSGYVAFFNRPDQRKKATMVDEKKAATYKELMHLPLVEGEVLKNDYVEIGVNGASNTTGKKEIIKESLPPKFPEKIQDHRISTQQFYNEARAKKEHFTAEIKRIELAEKRGALILRTVIEDEALQLATYVRAALISFAPKLAPLMIGIDDVPEVQKVIEREVNTVLTYFNKKIAPYATR